VVNFVLRARANHGGNNPDWRSYEKLRAVIEKKMFANTEDLLPVISFNAKASVDDQRKHDDFVKRMVQRGYTEKQVRLLSEWYLRVRKSQ
jgi:serine protein kinase